jgi:hypothetical protein
MIGPWCLFVCLFACLSARGETAFWVWNRSEPLTAEEKWDLRAANVKTLYWHFAEIENKSGEWNWKRTPHLPEKPSAILRIVPVVRLETSIAVPFAAKRADTLREKLVEALKPLHADEWQIDYDAPDRLVEDYAAFLKSLRPLAPKLSSTALAGWVRLPAFPMLKQSVAELCPMFYDLEPDTLATLRPLVEPASTRKLIAEWAKSCEIPWRVGLPWFARISVYGVDGKSRGHFRQWAWDDVVFKRATLLEHALKEGITVLRATEPMQVGRGAVQKDERLVLRWPDRATVLGMEQTAGHDVVFFRLPDAAASSGWSLRQFAARDREGEAELVLRRDEDRLVLTNVGPCDLPPRLVGDGPQDRGYALELDADGRAVFREALPGEFWRMNSHADPETSRQRTVRVGAATRLTFWFAALPAGRTLSTGLFQLTPAEERAPLRYRVLNYTEKTSWLPLAPSR